MPAQATHRLHRHPAADWAELRISVQSPHSYRVHTHAEYSIGIVDAGEATFYHPSGPQTVRAGNVVLIEPNVPHACNPRWQQGWSYRMLYIHADWLHEHVSRCMGLSTPVHALHFVSRSLEGGAIAERVNTFCRPIDCGADAHRLAHQLPQWLLPLMRIGGPADNAQVAPDLEPAFTRIEAGLSTALSVQDLARCCGMTPTRFIRRFKTAAGMTPGEYIRDLRTNGARRLIAHGASLAEAAYAMGFADQAHLQRSFKARHAMTPGNYAPDKATD